MRREADDPSTHDMSNAEIEYQRLIAVDVRLAEKFGLVPPRPGHTAKTSHVGYVYGCFDCLALADIVVRGCRGCEPYRDDAPSHHASPGCESGRRNHCSCGVCH